MVQVLFEMFKIAIKDTIKTAITNIRYIIGMIFSLGPSLFVLLNFNYIREYYTNTKDFENIHDGAAKLILFMIITPLMNVLIFMFLCLIYDLLIIYTKETYQMAKESIELKHAQKAQAGDISIAKTTGHGGLSMTDEK